MTTRSQFVRAARTLGPRIALASALALAAACALPGAARAQKAGEGFQTSAPHAILIDADSGSVLYEKAADQLTYPASLAKLMTVELVLHQVKEGDLPPHTEFVVRENAWRRRRAAGRFGHVAPGGGAGGGRPPPPGGVVQSGNDACIALAEGIAGNEATFARMMNERARELGLTKSTFGNSTGLHDPDQKVTMRELAKLAQHIIETYPDLLQDLRRARVHLEQDPPAEPQPAAAMDIGADGLKTGYTEEAGYGLVGSAVQNGQRLIVVVNGLKTRATAADEARKLLEWGFRAFESRPLFAEGEPVGEAKVFGGAKGRVPLVAKGRSGCWCRAGRRQDRRAHRLYRADPAPVEKGRQVGVLQGLTRGDVQALDMPL